MRMAVRAVTSRDPTGNPESERVRDAKETLSGPPDLSLLLSLSQAENLEAKKEPPGGPALLSDQQPTGTGGSAAPSLQRSLILFF